MRINSRLREEIRARERSYRAGTSMMDQQTYNDRQGLDETHHRQREGVIAGLYWAMDIGA